MSKKGLKVALVLTLLALTMCAWQIGWGIARAEWHDVGLHVLVLAWEMSTLACIIALQKAKRENDNLHKIIHAAYKDILQANMKFHQILKTLNNDYGKEKQDTDVYTNPEDKEETRTVAGEKHELQDNAPC